MPSASTRPLADHFRLYAATALLGVAACMAQQPAHAATAGDAALYDALGSRAGIATLIDDFVPRLMSDPQIGHFFEHSNAGDIGKQLSDQVCVVSGGPCSYEGATMKKAHAGLGISKADFNRMVELLQRSMDARGIAFADQNRLLARLAPMHRDVIEAAPAAAASASAPAKP